jgi:integrase
MARKIHVELLMEFLIEHVLRNKGSTRSLDTLMSNVRTESIIQKVEWLSPDEERYVVLMSRQMKFRDTSAGTQKAPLRWHAIRDILQRLELAKDQHLELAAVITLGHNGLLRSGEIAQLHVSDVLFNGARDRFYLKLSRSKTVRSGAGDKVEYRDFGRGSAVQMMRRWTDRCAVVGHRSGSLFPAISRSGKWSEAGVGTARIRSMIKEAVTLVGLDAKFYSGHSLRAGGATDLFVERAGLSVIKKMGRWASDAALLYYRCEDDVAEAVAEAFGRL